MLSSDPNRPVYTGIGITDLARIFEQSGTDLGSAIAELIRENPSKANLMSWNKEDMRRISTHMTLAVMWQLAQAQIMTAQQANDKYPRSIDELTQLPY